MSRTIAATGAWALALLAAHLPARAQTEPAASPDELEEIEQALGADQAELAEAAPAPPPGGVIASLNPDISLVLDVAFAWFSDHEPLQTGAHDPQGTGFTLQQLEFDLSKAVDPYFRLDAFIVFFPTEVEIEEAFATTLALPWSLQARAGQFLTRFGRHNAQHLHAWDFADQPFAIGNLLGPEGNRGIGAELSWLAPLPWYVEVVGAVTNPPGAEIGHAHNEEEQEEAAEALEVDGVEDLQYMAALKQFFDLSPNLSLMVGASYLTYPDPEHQLHVAGGDLYLKYRPITSASNTVVSLQVEWLRRFGDHKAHGGYAQLFWKFARRWGVAGRYEYGNIDEVDEGEGGRRHRGSAAVTFWPTEFSRLRLQGAVDDPTWREDPIASVFLTGEFIIGAHGAHKF